MKDETKAKKAIEKAGAAKDSDEGSEQTAASIVERAEQAAKRMAEEREEYAKILARQEEIFAKQKLGGQSQNTPKKEEKGDDDPKDYAKKVLSGNVKYSE